MPVIKLSRKVFGRPVYDISHTVNGTLTFNDRTVINLQSPAYCGVGDYKLFNYTNLVTGSNLVSIRSALDIQLPSTNMEAYVATCNNNSIYAYVYDTSAVIKDHVQTIDNGTLTIAGPTVIELDASIFNAAGTYALFDYRFGEFVGDLSDIAVTMSGSTSLMPSSVSVYGPYLVTTLS